MSGFYDGSNLLLPFANTIGISIDKINFVFSQLVAIVLGRIFILFFSPEHCSVKWRHFYQLVCGVSLVIFCFGIQIWHIIFQTLGVFFLINFVKGRYARVASFVFCLSHLSVMHLSRMYYDYQGYSLDITGPLMVLTQKLSSLSYNLYDGERLNKNIPLRSPHHSKHALRTSPSLLEMFSYSFSFHNLMVGPFVFMSDYLRFIEGREAEFLLPDSLSGQSVGEENQNELIHYFNSHRREILLAWKPLIRSLLASFLYLVLVQGLAPLMPCSIILTAQFSEHNWPMRFLLSSVVAFLLRCKYYFAWELARAVNLSAGFGFDGFSQDASHKPRYHLVKAFHFRNIELGNSAKVKMDNWNVGTTHWLREIVYDRSPKQYNILLTFLCSAFWHGFYPGYYLCFVSLFFFVAVARLCRKHLRPRFQDTALSRRVYDVLTSVAGISVLNYSALAFSVLGLREGVQVWRVLWFYCHVISVVLYVGLPLLLPTSGGGSRAAPAASMSTSTTPVLSQHTKSQ